MSHLFLLGGDYSQGYDVAKFALDLIKPDVVTLELPLFDYTGNVVIGKTMSHELWLLDLCEEEGWYSGNLYGGEFVAGAVHARRNGTPLYAIDHTFLSPEATTRFDLSRIRDPNLVFNDTIPQNAVRIRSMEERQAFMGAALDNLAERYPNGVVAHIGGSGHVGGTSSILLSQSGELLLQGQTGQTLQDYVSRYDRVTPGLLHNPGQIPAMWKTIVQGPQ